MPTQDFYSDINLKYNELQQGVIHRVNSFPANAREGQVIYNTIIKSFCYCINDSIDTTSFLAWKCSAMITDPIGIRALCTASENILDIVYIKDNGTVASAMANVITTANCVGFIRSKEEDTNCTVVTTGLLSGFNGAGLTAGKQYFLSKNYAGGITDIPPTDPGEVLIRVGIGFDTSTLYIDIDRALTIRT